MIGPIRIQNFKSIRDLSFTAKRVNVFIGEPNTGKSNIIEALAFFSEGLGSAFKEILRFKSTADLFFDQKVTNDVVVDAIQWRLNLTYQNGTFNGFYWAKDKKRDVFKMAPSGLQEWRGGIETTIRFYQFKPLEVFNNGQPGVLSPPYGDNLVAILYSNQALRQRIGAIIRERGFRLQLKPTEHELLIAKDVDDELYSYPWTSVSETLRRVAFLIAALETNKESTLLFDEPESNTFPFYTKYLAERIALDESNQFLFTTHNPYLLSSVVEKTPVKDLAVFVTRMENFETKLQLIPEKKLPELLELDSDAFFNLDRLVGE